MVFGLLEVLLVATASLFALIYLTRKKRDFNFPPGPNPLPILGNLHQIGSDPLNTFQKWAKKYGPIYSIKMGRDHTIVLNDHKLVKELFTNQISAGRNTDNAVFNALGKNQGIINAEGHTWEEQRRFTVRKLRDMGLLKRSIESLILVEVKSLLRVLERNAGKPVTDKLMFNGAVVSTLWSIVTGERHDWDAPTKPEIFKIADNLVTSVNNATTTGLVFAPSLRHIAPKMSGWIDWINGVSNFMELIDVTINKHIENHDPDNLQNFINHYYEQIRVEEDGRGESSFLKGTGVANLKASEISSLHEQFLSNFLLALLELEGSETSATSLSWAMLYLSQNQNTQRKMQNELDKVLGPPGSRLPSNADRHLLPFTEAVVQEILRLSPVAPLGVPHKMLNDMEFHGHLLPKGTTVWSNIFGIHHDPNIWGKDVEEFKPERFLSEDGTKVIRHEALIPFSVGRRQCLGEPLAKDTMLLFLSSIFHNFNVEPDPNCLKADMTPVFGLALRPKPYNVVFKGREKAM